MDRRAVAGALTALHGRRGVEARGHEDLAAARIEVEDRRRIRRKVEAVLLGPGADGERAALEHGDVERVDLGLEDDDSLVCC